ncbi:MAG TPA: polysaccharide biosynthesis/export family protein [Candidatus Dormibacteraeota bacterium]|nr:polysaccharide biosynthesis/export family protein [Candidatus Dormibacteraeota bacterium]
MMRRTKLWVVAGLLAAAIPVQAQQQDDNKKKSSEANAAATEAAPKKPATDDPNYVIGPQDVLDISVWKEPELTRPVPVRPDGRISMPLLNDVQAAGKTPLQLAADITAGLKKFVTDPQVTVIVTTINSQRVFILGEVNRAGAYPLLPNMTVLQALSSAGGFTIYANLKKIYLLRVEDGKQIKHPFNYKDVLAGKAADQNIFVKAGDTIVVP